MPCRWMLVAAAAALALAGCGASGAGTKAGGEAAPITLTIGTDDVPVRPSTDQIEHFAELVEGLSGGQLRIEPRWQAEGDPGEEDWDQKVARLVVSGDLDLGLIPTRAWDTEGVTSMRALNAPMLVTTDSLVTQVITGDLAATLMSGLDHVGVTGLALLPEGTRRVLSFGEPLREVADFRGALLRVPASDTTYATFIALGAVPDDVTANPQAVQAGEVAAAESSFVLAPTLPKGPTSAVGNLPLWPKVNSLVANAAVLAALSEQQRTILRRAAAQTRDWVIATQPGDAQAAATYCAAGNRVVTISDDAVAEFREATRPVIDDLDKDPVTRRLIEAVEALARNEPRADPVGPCDPTDASSTPASAPPSPTTGAASPGEGTGHPSPGEEGPNGVYRATVTAEMLRDGGVIPTDVPSHAGVWTLTFDHGRLVIHDVNALTHRAHSDDGVYCLVGERISWGLNGKPCGTFLSGQWHVDGDELSISSIQGQELLVPTDQELLASIFGSVPFVRVR